MLRNVILRILSTHTSKSAENRPRKIDFTIFSKWRGGDDSEGSIWGVKISNRRNGVRVSQNHENHVFEYICLDLVESSGESPPILRKMFRGHLGVENRFFRTPILALSVILIGC